MKKLNGNYKVWESHPKSSLALYLKGIITDKHGKVITC